MNSIKFSESIEILATPEFIFDYTQDYTREYQLAETAYLQGNYQESANIIDGLVNKFSNDPSVRLLRGHIYCYGLYQYEIGRESTNTYSRFPPIQNLFNLPIVDWNMPILA
ncbi:MAG: hypothetical protein HC778_03795 [Chamaesiphon sp. CSU_1_12]|nr:hypothetical protein [Chamaesiphon sp. CSU_1_12]